MSALKSNSCSKHEVLCIFVSVTFGSVFDMQETSSVPRPPSVEVRFISGVFVRGDDRELGATPRRRWSIEISRNPAVASVRRANRSVVEAAVRCVPRGTADVVAHHARVQAMLAVTRSRAETYTDIGLLCERMPRLKARLLTGILSVDHLRLIARSTDGIRHEDTARAEEALIGILTPRRDGQQVPGPRALARKVLKAVHGVDERARPVDPSEPAPPAASCADAIGTVEQGRSHDVDPPVGIDPRDGGTLTRRVGVDSYDPCATVITVTLPPEEAEEVVAILDAVCRELACSRADGLLHLARGTVDTRVTLNLYREINSDVAATSGGHWLDAVATDAFMDRVTHLRIPGHEATEAYTPTSNMVEFLEGVYTSCTFPGCEVPAAKCDIDHVHRFDHDDPGSGGPTDTRNLHPLCRTHHRLKTLGWVDATKGVDGAVMWSSVDDGHIYVTEPTGPLAGFSRTSFAERASRRFRTVRERNDRRMAERAARQAVLASARRASTEKVPF